MPLGNVSWTLGNATPSSLPHMATKSHQAIRSKSERIWARSGGIGKKEFKHVKV
jgi:hypothetical protein